MKQDVTVELAGGKQIKFETGRMAKQAPGAALTSSGDNVVLATATASPDPKRVSISSRSLWSTVSSLMRVVAFPAGLSSVREGRVRRRF